MKLLTILLISCTLIIYGCYMIDTTQLLATSISLITLGALGLTSAPLFCDLLK